jgi:transcriptional regulator with XRE-family HTH domain
MNMIAIGTYMATLRDLRGLTQQEVATAVGTTATTVSRYETGRQKRPDMQIIMKIIAAIKGSGNHLTRLVLDENATPDMAIALAWEAQLSTEDRAIVEPFATSDEDTLRLLQVVYDIGLHDKAMLREVMGYINGIKARDGQPPSDTPPTASRRQKRAK